MTVNPDKDEQIVTSCPHCGEVSWVSPAETLSPQVCKNCQKIHVATLNLESASESSVYSLESAPATVDDSALTEGRQPTPNLGAIARYQVTEVLGSGAFGVVYLGWDPSLHRKVAIKVPKISGQRKKVVDDFLLEARTAAQLRHPRIASVFDADTASGQPFIVTEFVEGDTLAALVQKGRLPPRRAAKIIYELALALSYAHQQGVVHRDVKPGNVMIDSNGQPRLMDFGLAQQSGEMPSPSEGKLAGTPAYMAPELAQGKALGGTVSDQYSLGVVLYECLVGRRPFDGPLPVVLRRIAKETPPRPRTLVEQIPQELDDICTRMMAPEPADRFKDLAAVAKQLAAFLKPPTDPAINSRAQSDATLVASPPRRRTLIVVAIAVAALFGVFLATRTPLSSTSSTPDEAPIRLAEVSSTDRNTPPLNPSSEADVTTTVEDNVVPIAQPAPVTATDETPIADAPVDALTAVEFAESLEPDLEIISVQPTYPELVGLAADQQITFRKALESLLATGLPRNGKLMLDDAAFGAASEEFAALKNMAPNEPRVSYAMALIHKRHHTGRKIDKNKDAELELLTESQTLGGYPFTPAYLSEVEYHMRQEYPKADRVKNALLGLADAINTPAAWPDRPERLRVVIWLGNAYGFFASGVSGKPSFDAAVMKSLETVERSLNPDLRDAFLSSMLDTQTRIADKIKDCNAKVQVAGANNLLETKKKLDGNIEDQGAVAIKLAETQLIGEELDKEFEGTMKKLETEFKLLERRSFELQRQAAPLAQQHTTVLDAIARASAQLAQLQADAANGLPADPSLESTAQDALSQAQSQAAVLNAQLQALNAQDQQVRKQAYVLIQQAQATERSYRQQKGQKKSEMAKFQKTLAKLEDGAMATIVKGAKAQPRAVGECRNIIYFRTWVQWSIDDARNWLIQSVTVPDPNS